MRDWSVTTTYCGHVDTPRTDVRTLSAGFRGSSRYVRGITRPYVVRSAARVAGGIARVAGRPARPTAHMSRAGSRTGSLPGRSTTAPGRLRQARLPWMTWGRQGRSRHSSITSTTRPPGACAPASTCTRSAPTTTTGTRPWRSSWSSPAPWSCAPRGASTSSSRATSSSSTPMTAMPRWPPSRAPRSCACTSRATTWRPSPPTAPSPASPAAPPRPRARTSASRGCAPCAAG